MSQPALPPPNNATPPTELSQTVAGAVKPIPLPQGTSTPDKHDQGAVSWMVEKSFDITILVVALLNLTVVFFDYSYVMLRPQYLKHAPEIARLYDPIKGIEPHDQTKKFLDAADDALVRAAQNPDAPETMSVLQTVQQLGTDIIKDDPFTISNQRGVLERIKHLSETHMGERARTDEVIRNLVGQPDVQSAVQVFTKAKGHSITSLAMFWTPENLRAATYGQESAWYTKTIRPLMNRAYYRHYGEDGKLIDKFWQFDLLFACIMLVELLLRAFWVLGVQGGRGLSMKERIDDFAKARWMDLLYFLPLLLYAPIINDLLPQFIRESLQLVRLFSIGYRMQCLGLINPVAVAIRKGEEFTDHITNRVNVKLLSNYQQSIQQMDMEKTMKSLSPQQREQLTVLIQRNMTMVLRDVLPDITPVVEKLIMRAATQALEQAPAYQQLKRFPFFGALPERMLPNLVAEVLTGTQVTMLKAINDKENLKLTNEMIDAVTASLLKHMAEVGTEDEIKKLLYDMLEAEKHKVLSK